MTDQIAVTILTVLIVGYVATLASSIQQVLEPSNELTCCMKIPYVYRGQSNEVCYNPTDTTYNFVEQKIIRQWEQQ